MPSWMHLPTRRAANPDTTALFKVIEVFIYANFMFDCALFSGHYTESLFLCRLICCSRGNSYIQFLSKMCLKLKRFLA